MGLFGWIWSHLQALAGNGSSAPPRPFDEAQGAAPQPQDVAAGGPVPRPPPASAATADFFISYTAVDEAWASWIAFVLERERYSVIIQAWDFRPGNNFVLMMDFATRAKHTIIVLSKAFTEAHFTQPEWARAFADDPMGLRRTLIPIRIEECDLGGLLKAIVYIDIVGLKEEDACARILEGVRPGRAKPAAAPPFPGPPAGA